MRKLCFNILIELQYERPNMKGHRSTSSFGTNILNTNRNFTFFKWKTNLKQNHYFNKYAYIKAKRWTRQSCKKKIKLDQAFMNNVEKTLNCTFKSGRLSLLYFEYVKTLFGSISSQNIETQQIRSAKYTRGVQYVMKTAQYIPKFCIYTLHNYFF